MNIKQMGLLNLLGVTGMIIMMWIDKDVIRTNMFMSILLPLIVSVNYVKLLIQQDATKRTKEV